MTGTGWNPKHTYDSSGKKTIIMTGKMTTSESYGLNGSSIKVWSETILFKTSVKVIAQDNVPPAPLTGLRIQSY